MHIRIFIFKLLSVITDGVQLKLYLHSQSFVSVIFRVLTELLGADLSFWHSIKWRILYSLFSNIFVKIASMVSYSECVLVMMLRITIRSQNNLQIHCFSFINDFFNFDLVKKIIIFQLPKQRIIR